MSEFKLPGIDPAAVPEFADGPSCKAWLENVPLANVSTAQHQLLVQVEEFNRYACGARERFEALEAIREAVNFVQIEQAKRFTNRALPMQDAEAAVFEDTIELWEQMRLGYLRCLEADDGALRQQRALICQRALAYSGLRMFHHYRAYRQVPGRDWLGLHRVYARAEGLGVAEEAVKDFLNRDVHDTSPRIAAMRAVLMGMCNPNELGPRQLTFVAHLLERWAVKLEVSEDPQVVANGYIVEGATSEGKPFRLAAAPIQFGAELPATSRAPEFNEHCDEILESIGLDIERILDLKVRGVIA